MARRICLFPGTFDPVTLGHTDVINRAKDLFDELIIGIGINSGKVPMFSVEQRVAWFQEIYKDDPKIKAAAYEGLTVNFCKEVGAKYILRGIRYVSDFEYEKAIADMNRMLDHDVETFFLTASAEHATMASTLVRDVLKNGGDVSRFVPGAVAATFKKHFG